MPKVSVVMPVFNGERFVGDSIASVLAQKSVDLELIVVNDGSTDRSLEIIQQYAKAETRLRILNRPNSGRPSFPKNEGIAAASGDYICFLDQDDLYDPDRTLQLVNGLDNNPDWVAVFSDMRFIDGNSSQLPGRYLSEFHFLERAAPFLTAKADDWFECGERFFVFQALASGALHTSTVLIARNRLPAGTVMFDTRFTHADDVDLWMRLGFLGKIGYLNRVLATYRKHENNLTNSFEKLELDTALLHKHNFARVEKKLQPEELRQLRSRIAACDRSVAYVRYQQLRLVEARAAYRESLSWSFSLEATIGYLKTFFPAGVIRGIGGLWRQEGASKGKLH